MSTARDELIEPITRSGPLFRPDRPRAIDRFIDYFGDRSSAGAGGGDRAGARSAPRGRGRPARRDRRARAAS
jgi:hypothetical protein